MTMEAAPLPTNRPNPFDPPEDYRVLRENQPISRMILADGSLGWVVTSYELVRSVLADPRFSADARKTTSPHRILPEAARQPRPGFFLQMDAPDHTRYRSQLTGQFTVRRMKSLEPRIHEHATDTLDEMQRAGDTADLVGAFAKRLPSLMLCELLGVPYDERGDFQRFTEGTPQTNLPRERAERSAQIAAAVIATNEYVLQLVRRKRKQPGDDMLSGLMTSDPTLTDEEVAGMGRLLLLAGHDTTASMLALGTFLLLQHPEQAAAIRRDPETVNRAVEEILRYLTIVQFGAFRAATEDLEVGGQLVRAGETVVCSLAAANRDPRQFIDPDRLDVTREHTPHVAFGHGAHWCLGHHLGRLEMRVGYRELFTRLPKLRLAIPPQEIEIRTGSTIYGLQSLPVAWS
ncbi:cytochrome P450 [Streptomyces sp. NPDC002519]